MEKLTEKQMKELEAIKKQIKGSMKEVDFMYEIYKMEYNYGY